MSIGLLLPLCGYDDLPSSNHWFSRCSSHWSIKKSILQYLSNFTSLCRFDKLLTFVFFCSMSMLKIYLLEWQLHLISASSLAIVNDASFFNGCKFPVVRFQTRKFGRKRTYRVRYQHKLCYTTQVDDNHGCY